MIAITGGAGFIGSRLAEKLSKQNKIIVIDNLSSSQKSNIPEDVEFIEEDIKNRDLSEVLESVKTVFHFAANPKVSTFPSDKDKDFEENLRGTKNVLDACEKAVVKEVVFASSSVVYGEDAEIPTPEEHNLNPISMYGATKAGGEHICQVYGQTFDLDLTILRFANIIGPRNQKGVIYDFIQKLEENPNELEILGNGKQKKSYLYIEDTINAIIKAWKSPRTAYNIGSEDSISVDRIAEIISEEMDIEPKYSYTGGEKGWKGDVPEMRLDIERLKKEGWKPSHNSEESVKKTARELLKVREIRSD